MVRARRPAGADPHRDGGDPGPSHQPARYPARGRAEARHLGPGPGQPHRQKRNHPDSGRPAPISCDYGPYGRTTMKMHPLIIRGAHWTNAIAMIIMISSV